MSFSSSLVSILTEGGTDSSGFVSSTTSGSSESLSDPSALFCTIYSSSRFTRSFLRPFLSRPLFSNSSLKSTTRREDNSFPSMVAMLKKVCHTLLAINYNEIKLNFKSYFKISTFSMQNRLQTNVHVFI